MHNSSQSYKPTLLRERGDLAVRTMTASIASLRCWLGVPRSLAQSQIAVVAIYNNCHCSFAKRKK
jgi:hypothetical protein